MTDDQRNQHNAYMLTQLAPYMQPRIKAVLLDMENHGYRPRIQCAWRSPADQLAAYNSGHSKLQFGFHNVTQAGHPYSFAADILDDSNPMNPSTAYLLTLAASAQAHGLETGIRWGLPTKLRAAIEAAIEAKKWNAPVKVGWDPTHCQIVGITPKQAQGGMLPR